jgi:hypothetical protein
LHQVRHARRGPSEGGAFVMTLPDPPQESVSGIEFAVYDCPAQRWFEGINREVDDAMPAGRGAGLRGDRGGAHPPLDVAHEHTGA